MSKYNLKKFKQMATKNYLQIPDYRGKQAGVDNATLRIMQFRNANIKYPHRLFNRISFVNYK